MTVPRGTEGVVVVGGGAAGFFAAIACRDAGFDGPITILERTAEVLAKVKISGGGRCNVTHACFEPDRLVTFYPRGARALRGPFSRFQPKDTVEWFESRGVPLKTESDGRMFPVSDSSQSIIDVLLKSAEDAQIEIRRQTLIQSIRADPAQHGFTLALESGEELRAHRVILATGSNPMGWTWARDLGHTIEPPVPSLFTLSVSDPRIAGLAGVSVPTAQVRLVGTKFEQTGPLLITHAGFSGPAILKLSAWAARAFHEKDYRAEISISWVPDKNIETAREDLRTFRTANARRAAVAGGPYPCPKRLWARLIEAAGIEPATHWSQVSNAQLLALTKEVVDGRYLVTGKSPFKEEFVTCGGVTLDEVDFRTMESKRQPGLYFAGEVLDIDAVTGGFNFQAAWTTGWIAGRSARGLTQQPI